MPEQVIERTPADNMQKYENYAEQFRRLKKAMDNGFHLEAAFICYSIIEDRTESVLRHGGHYEAYLKSRKGHQVTLDSKVKYIQKKAENRQDPLRKIFGDTLLDDILVWKDRRNALVHALMKQVLAHGEVAAMAQEGEMLAKELRNRSSRYNRALERQMAR